MDKNFSIAVVVEHDQNGIKPVTYEVINAALKISDSIVAYYFSNDPKVESFPSEQPDSGLHERLYQSATT